MRMHTSVRHFRLFKNAILLRNFIVLFRDKLRGREGIDGLGVGVAVQANAFIPTQAWKFCQY